MRRRRRPLQSRFARLLAWALVACLLGNGVALAQATAAMPAAAMAAHDAPGCCGHAPDEPAAGHCEQVRAPATTPCPSGADCDTQCMMRCQSGGALPMIALMLPSAAPASTLLALRRRDERPLAHPRPGLRPPISA